MLTNEMKREAFLKLRTENYRASLRLEGLVQRNVGANKPAVEGDRVNTRAPAALGSAALPIMDCVVIHASDEKCAPLMLEVKRSRTIPIKAARPSPEKRESAG